MSFSKSIINSLKGKLNRMGEGKTFVFLHMNSLYELWFFWFSDTI